MNENRLKRFFPNASKAFIDLNSSREDPGIQEQALGKQAGQDQDRSKDAKEDGRDNPKFCVTVAVFISGRRKKDLDNMQQTILDCLLHARRRFLASY